MDDPTMPDAFVSFFLETFWYPIAFLYGAIVGSFLNVLIYRLPLIWEEKFQEAERQRIAKENNEEPPPPKEIETISGKSRCPRCFHYLEWWQNVPIFGFLYLGGRCFYCKTRISWRYFAVELLTACLWTALYHSTQPRNIVDWTSFLFLAIFIAVLVALTFIDLDHFIAPDELNLTTVILGVGRDIACVGLALLLWKSTNSSYLWEQTAPKYLWFGWVPWCIPGALTYGFVMLAVSVISHMVYARVPWETAGAALVRYWKFEGPPPPPDDFPIPEEELLPEEEDDTPPIRLHFSPGFLALLSALLFVPIIHWWAVLFFLVPLVAFSAISRVPGEAFGVTVNRFFSADDQKGLPNDALPVDSDPALTAPDALADPAYLSLEAKMQAEADEFAKEAETGSAGGMGFGDVKLAFGIGAMLGPGMALLSLFFATLLGAVTGITLKLVAKKENLRIGVPFVPFMAAGAIIALLYGAGLIQWYLQISGMAPKPVETPNALPPAIQRRRQREGRPISPQPGMPQPRGNRP